MQQLAFEILQEEEDQPLPIQLEKSVSKELMELMAKALLSVAKEQNEVQNERQA